MIIFGEFDYIIVLQRQVKKFLAVGIYHPFKCFEGESIRSNFQRLLHNLNRICDSHPDILVFGDFNVPLDNDLRCPLRLLLDSWSEAFDLDQLINTITRTRLVQGYAQTSILDLIFTNLTSILIDSEFSSLSDHVILKMKIGPNSNRQSQSYIRKVGYLDWRQYNPICARGCFLTKFDGINIHSRHPESVNEKITTAICLMLNELVPVRSTTLRGLNSVINPRIQNLKTKNLGSTKFGIEKRVFTTMID